MKTLLIVVLAGLITQACAVTPTAIASTPVPPESSQTPVIIPPEQNQLPSVIYSLAGRDVNVFGEDSTFIKTATDELVMKGAFVMESADWHSALGLSGSTWITLYCYDIQRESEVIILARNSALIERWPDMVTIPCDNGLVLPGYRFPGAPDVLLK